MVGHREMLTNLVLEGPLLVLWRRCWTQLRDRLLCVSRGDIWATTDHIMVLVLRSLVERLLTIIYKCSVISEYNENNDDSDDINSA